MKCPFCQTPDTRVVDSRDSKEGFAIRRRRECTACSRRFTTYETIFETTLFVIKKDSSRVPFDRQRMIEGVRKACYKRPISPEAIEDLVAKVEARIFADGRTEIPSKQIGEMLMEELRNFDQVAYVRFASVYRQFNDAADFAQEIGTMLNGKT